MAIDKPIPNVSETVVEVPEHNSLNVPILKA